MSHEYVLLTPCKNEGENLSNLIESIASQTIRPVIWVIVDDGSTDDTPMITRKATENYEWIKVLRLEEGKRDLGMHVASITKMGFDFAIEYCMKNGIDYKYLGNVDGDLTLEPTFFENLIREFENDPLLGIASGGTNHIIGNHIVHAKLHIDEPSGGHMLIRKECFEDCGGISLSYDYVSELKAKARIRGWS